MKIEGVWLVDSVSDPDSVQALRQALLEIARGLPFIQDKVPSKWLTVRDVLLKLKGKKVMERRLLVVEMGALLKEREVVLTERELWDAVEFWGHLGEIKVHRDTVVLDVVWLIDLLKPLLHHDPCGSLSRIDSGENVTKV